MYNLSERDLTFVIDKQVPDHPEPPVDPDNPDASGFDFIYPEGIGGYRPGTVVKGSDGNRYQCRPFPSSDWCKRRHSTTLRQPAWPGPKPGFVFNLV